MMKRLLQAMVFTLAMSLSVMAAEAQVAQVEAGCDNSDNGMWSVMKRHADVQRVRDRAYSYIVKQNDSTLAVSCFDQALALSARLGAIFSDFVPQDMPALNAMIFSRFSIDRAQDLAEDEVEQSFNNVYNRFGGIGVNAAQEIETLATAYQATLGQTFAGHLSGNFAASLTMHADFIANLDVSFINDLGQTVIGALDGLSEDITGFIDNQIMGRIDAITGQIDTLMNTVGGFIATVDGLLSLQVSIPGVDINLSGALGLESLGDLSGQFDFLDDFREGLAEITALKTTITGQISGAVGAVNDSVGGAAGAIDNAVGEIVAAAGTLVGDFTAGFTDVLAAGSVLGSLEASMTGFAWADVLGGVEIPKLDLGAAALVDIPPNLASLPNLPGLPALPDFPSLPNLNIPAAGCAMPAMLWGGGVLDTGELFAGIEGAGALDFRVMPFVTFADLVTGSVTGGGEFAAELTGNVGAQVMTAARADLETRLSAPGTLAGWTLPPVIGPDNSTDDIIGLMAQ